MSFLRGVLFFTLVSSSGVVCAEEVIDKPKWEVGAGFGYLRFEHYPGSNQYTDLAIPFPTFVYRGEILRADDREGAKIYVIKSPEWTFQLGGVLFPPLSSSANTLRVGMDDLPLVVAPGPQLQRTFDENWSAKIGFYQALGASWTYVKGTGVIWEATTTFQDSYELGHRVLGFDEGTTTLSLGIMGASQELHEFYYGVPLEYATASRPSYHADAGALATQLSFFQSLKRGDLAVYVGARVSDFGSSANRASPLFAADRNYSLLFGLTYSLHQSESRVMEP